MPSKTYSATTLGLEAKIIEVETDVTSGLRSFTLVGLPAQEVREARRRIGSALKSAGFSSPHSKPEKILVNLAPADLRKQGSLYDLPIALSYLSATKQLPLWLEKKLFIGELALDGRLRPVKGSLSFALEGRNKGFEEIILPYQNAKEASLAQGIKAIGVKTLREAIEYLKGRRQIAPASIDSSKLLQKKEKILDIGWIKGQQLAKRALEITAAGNHHIIMVGPPGTGKTLLAKSICSILPPLDFAKALEVTKIHSIAGVLSEKNLLVNLPPFRSPHHTSSEASLIGGGNPPWPGEITLAQYGVLFLDEFPEFHRNVLESLRQPLEKNRITILRARHRSTFPAQFTLVCAANPCPCGHYKDPKRKCTCTASQLRNYRRKLHGPLIDRIDIFVEVPALEYKELIQKENLGQSEKIRERVERARQIQNRRFRGAPLSTNSQMSLPQIKKYCSIPTASKQLLCRYINSGKLTARGYHRVLKIARTIADLEDSPEIKNDHLSEAVMYRVRRSLDKQ